jgi:outer membrane lipoprotein-sorting protein
MKVLSRYGNFFMTRVMLSVSLSLVSSILSAQDFKAALLKMKQEYADAPNLHIVMSIKVFDKDSPGSIFYHQKAEVKKADQKYYYALDENEMLLNPTCLVMVNHKLKQISLRKNNLTADAQVNPSLINLDSMLSVYGNASYVGKQNGLDHYRIVHKAGGVLKQTEMFFQATNGQLQQIEYEYGNGQQVSIQFELFDKSPQFDANTFSEMKYVNTVNGKVSLAQHFRTYRLTTDGGDSTGNSPN